MGVFWLLRETSPGHRILRSRRSRAQLVMGGTLGPDICELAALVLHSQLCHAPSACRKDDRPSEFMFQNGCDVSNLRSSQRGAHESLHPLALTPSVADQDAVNVDPSAIEVESAWSPNHNHRFHGEVETLRSKAKQSLDLQCAINCLHNRNPSQETDDFTELDPATIRGPSGFDDEHSARTNEQVINIPMSR